MVGYSEQADSRSDGVVMMLLTPCLFSMSW